MAGLQNEKVIPKIISNKKSKKFSFFLSVELPIHRKIKIA
jgi:hypothetical protein